jgi:hypothetical protein
VESMPLFVAIGSIYLLSGALAGLWLRRKDVPIPVKRKVLAASLVWGGILFVAAGYAGGRPASFLAGEIVVVAAIGARTYWCTSFCPVCKASSYSNSPHSGYCPRCGAPRPA